MSEEKDVVWGYATSEDAEYWHGAGTREDAEQGAIESAKGGGWIRSGSMVDAGEYVPDAEEIMERMAETAADNGCPDELDDPFIYADGAEAALNALLSEWAKKYVKGNWWSPDTDPIKVYSPSEET